MLADLGKDIACAAPDQLFTEGGAQLLRALGLAGYLIGHKMGSR